MNWIRLLEVVASQLLPRVSRTAEPRMTEYLCDHDGIEDASDCPRGPHGPRTSALFSVDRLAVALHDEFYDDSVPHETGEACCRPSAERILGRLHADPDRALGYLDPDPLYVPERGTDDEPWTVPEPDLPADRRSWALAVLIVALVVVAIAWRR